MPIGRKWMAGLGSVTLALYCCVPGVLAECPNSTVDAIRALWNGKPPTNILESQVGTVTYVWMTRRFLEDHLDKGLVCYATNLAIDLTSSTDIMVYTNGTADELSYYQTEKDGVITLHSHKQPHDTQYVLSYKDHVCTFWQCKQSNIETYDPFVGISVEMRYMDTEASRRAIEEGKRTLDDLKINTGAPLTPCTWENLKI